MGLTILGDDPAKFVNGILLLDVHWSNEDVWNFLGLRKGEGKAIAKVNILQHEVLEEIRLHQGSLVIVKDEGISNVCQPAVLVEGLRGHSEPLVRIWDILVQLGWYWKILERVLTSRNSDP